MNSEQNRLDTFTAWTNPNVTKESLAAAGLYCISKDDAVRCAFCGGVLFDWKAGDDPRTEHDKYFPDCSEYIVGDVPPSAKYLNYTTNYTVTPEEWNHPSFTFSLSYPPGLTVSIRKPNLWDIPALPRPPIKDPTTKKENDSVTFTLRKHEAEFLMKVLLEIFLAEIEGAAF